MSRAGSSAGRPHLRMDDYCFGKRIVDDRNKLTGNFRPGAKKGLSLQPQGTADALGPGGSYSVYSSFGKATTYNKKGTFGAPPSKPLKKTQLLENGATYHETTELTSEVKSSFGQDIEKAPKFTRPVTPRTGRKIYDTKLCQGTSEMTSEVKSTFGADIHKAPRFSKPVTPRNGRQIYDVKHSQGATGEFTAPVASSFKPPPRAKTPPVNRSIRRTFAESFPVSQSEFTAEVYSSFPKPNLIPKNRHVGTKKTDSWLKTPRDSGPGPGEYFVP